VSAYDAQYATKSTKNIQQATGGSLAVLYHNKVGTVLAASMAHYIEVEVRNQQAQPGQEFALTPRVETFKDGVWYTNLYDLTADVEHTDNGELIQFDVHTNLQDLHKEKLAGDVADYHLTYQFDKQNVTISAQSKDGAISKSPSALVVPIISPTGEEARQPRDNRIEVVKPGGTVVVESNVPLSIRESEKGRIFNMVPGMECVPIIAPLPREAGMKAACTITVV
jgi:hypothetical protein